MSNKVSVAIATYNGEKYISRQLTSIVEQTIPPNEIVICDDKSTDKTLEIINSFSKVYNSISWKIILNHKNIGYKKNFAKAILNTTGDIVFLSDQDDLWAPQKIEKMIHSFDKNRKIKVLASKFVTIDFNKVPNLNPHKDNFNCNNTKRYPEKNLKRISFRKSFYMTHFPGCSLAIRKECKEWFLDRHWDGNQPHDEYLLIIGQLDDSAFFLNDSLFFYIRHRDATTYGKMKNRQERINHLEKKYDSLLIALDYVNTNDSIASRDKKIKTIKKEMRFLSKRISFLRKPSFARGLALTVCFYRYEKLSYYIADLYFSKKNN